MLAHWEKYRAWSEHKRAHELTKYGWLDGDLGRSTPERLSQWRKVRTGEVKYGETDELEWTWTDRPQ